MASDVKVKSEGGIWDTIKVIFQALLIAIVLRALLFQPFFVPSGSLIPTLLIGDRLFVSKFAYGYSKYSFPFTPFDFKGRVFGSEPKRGDIAVFHNSKDGGKDYIKRVVGLPGDRIQMIKGVLVINGTPVPRERLADEPTETGTNRSVIVPRYRETLPNGVSYTIIKTDGDNGTLDNTSTYEVPLGHFFMMGDNRDNSSDSRVQSSVGYVPLENFIGKAEFLFFSIDTGEAENTTFQGFFKSLLDNKTRWSRIFQLVR
jgi:signal peptidase I